MVHRSDHGDEEDGNFWHSVNKLSKNQDRPKRNSMFLGFLFLAGIVGVVVFAVMAVITKDNRAQCPCAQPFRIVGNGDKIPDQEQCLKDMTYMACYNKRTQQYKTYAGLAGGSGGLLAVCALLFRYG